MGFTKKELVQFLDGLVELVSVERRTEALLIKERFINEFEKSYGFRKEEVVIADLPPYYVADLPHSVQKKIKKEVVAGLREIGECTPENIDRAMSSKIYDLEELIDIGKYVRPMEDRKNSYRVTDYEKSR